MGHPEGGDPPAGDIQALSMVRLNEVKPERERLGGGIGIHRPKKESHPRSRSRRSNDREWSAPRFNVKQVQKEKGEPGNVVSVEMADQDSVNVVYRKGVTLERSQGCGAAVDEQGGAGASDQICCILPSSGGEGVPGPQKYHFVIFHGCSIAPHPGFAVADGTILAVLQFPLADETAMKNPSVRLKKRLLRGVGQAIADYGMIVEGDRVMVCVSGGKDSYTMLSLLRDLQRRAPVRFELLAVVLDQSQPGFAAHVVSDYLSLLDIPFRLVRKDVYGVVARTLASGDTACSLCSRLRRGVLYNVAVEERCSKLALGHHADDIIQTFLLNLFFEGSTRGMPPVLRSEDGRNTVIRPLAYCWESDIKQYAAIEGFPIVSCGDCGVPKNLQRKRMDHLVNELEKEIPSIRNSMLSALQKPDIEAVIEKRSQFSLRTL